ncbi:MAG: Na+/H+ antiporter NhaA [Acidimicrobiales bacterium]
MAPHPDPPASVPPATAWLPEAWTGAVVRLVGTEALGGVVLTATVVAALLWANLAGGSYAAAWDRSLQVAVAPGDLLGTTRQWVDNGVMTIFFFAVGLEVGRERTRGSLRDNRNALLPVVAALGGMAGAALVYLATVAVQGGGRAALHGWGVPMATDVAFTLGAMALLGRRVPSTLRIFVLALAVADDVASVVVLAVVSSAHIHVAPLVGAAACLAGTVVLRVRRVWAWWPYVAAVVATWLLLAWAGIEPTLAGAFVGVLVPCTGRTERTGSNGRRRERRARPDAVDCWGGPSGRLEEVASPLATFAVVPLFALANTGVVLTGSLLTSPSSRTVVVALVVARLLGKMGGITLAVLAVVALGKTGLPRDVRWSQLAGAGAMCGMGFTVPLLFASAAFADHPALVGAAQVGLLAGTVLAFVVGATVLVLASARRPAGDVAGTRPPGPGHRPTGTSAPPPGAAHPLAVPPADR